MGRRKKAAANKGGGAFPGGCHWGRSWVGPGGGSGELAYQWARGTQSWGKYKGDLWAEVFGIVSQMGRRDAKTVRGLLTGLPGHEDTITNKETSWGQTYQLQCESPPHLMGWLWAWLGSNKHHWREMRLWLGQVNISEFPHVEKGNNNSTYLIGL